ncbi:MAG: HAMP domain-containing histidine kinase [Myxococcales bacterium]|nr:HAMP domain-containing histidine kinase [Myxococcales bacterium]
MASRRTGALRSILLAAIVVAAGFLAWWTWHTSAALATLGERSVIDSTALLAREKIDRVESVIIGADNAVFHLIDPDDLDDLTLRWPGLADRISPTIRGLLVLDEGGQILRAVRRHPTDDPQRLPWLYRALRDELHLDDPAGYHRHLHGTWGGQRVLVSHLVGHQGQRRYHLLLETDLDYVLNELLPRLFDDPLTRGRFNVTDENNRIVLGQSLSGLGDFVVSARFPTTLYKWRLAMAPGSAPELGVRARRRRVAEGGYVLLSLGVILAGVAFLVYAVRREERANVLKSDFIATVSHELKTPLSVIRMFGEMLATERVHSAEKRAHYLAVIVRESERLTALIDNLLDFARLERGRASYEFVSADLGLSVAQLVSLFCERQAREKPAVVFEPVDEAVPVRLDTRALQLLVFNLLDNAFKYAGESETVTVRVTRQRGDAVLEIEDRGPGIDPDDQRRIFERFYRGRAARQGQTRGSGIGLALVKHIARAHGGAVSVRNAAPQGSVFRVTLPLDLSREGEQDLPSDGALG